MTHFKWIRYRRGVTSFGCNLSIGELSNGAMAAPTSLKRYIQKRDFKKTPEPQGGKPSGGQIFVIQKHAASHLHYDFRLEAEGVLKSWAIPKGPSTDPQVRRLAMQVEDHPLDYAGFEGVIPQGEYGGGNVIVWDRGTYRNITTHKGSPISFKEGLARGHIAIWLEGKKLHGGYALTRTKDGPKPAWLFNKMNDTEAFKPENPVETLPASVLSGRGVEQIGGKKERVWHAGGEAARKSVARKRARPVVAAPLVTKKKAVAASESQTLKIEGKAVNLSHLNKVLYPSTGYTKGQVLNYYIQVAPYLLPHLKGRPLTMKRYPDGVDSSFFYEKQAPHYRPSWMATYKMSDEEKKRVTEYAIINDIASLVWVANLACLEFHTLLARAPAVDNPTMIAFDLDPGDPATLLDCGTIALSLRTTLEKLKLKSFLKTSGSKGLHLYIPLNTKVSYDATKQFAHSLALLFERQNPKGVVSNMSKALRKGKIFIDWSQNSRHKTTVTAYSLRAMNAPSVSTPITWEELEKALRKKDVSQLRFSPEDVLKRLQKQGDLFAPLQTLRQTLPRLENLAK